MCHLMVPVRRSVLPVALTAMLALPAMAAEPDPCAGTQPDGANVPCRAALLSTMTVSATLNPRPLGEVAADVSVITREDMDRHLVDSLQDLVRYQPGVSVTATPGRFGESGFSIRGLGGNRVRIEVDGVPVSDAFSFGSMLSAGRNTVDMDAIKRVEIVRGPASSLYGSDALGGVVSYVTKDPTDYLDEGKPQYLSLKHQYATVNRGNATSATFAAGDQRHAFMLLGSHRNAYQSNNMGRVDSADESRTRPDPQQHRGNALLGKYVHHADSGRIDRLVLDAQQNDTDTTLLSANDADTASMRGMDRTRRGRISFGQSWQSLGSQLADRVDWKAWAQNSRVEQRSQEHRLTGPGYERYVDQRFSQRVLGAQLHAFRTLQTGSVQHDLTWGGDLSQTRTSELRDGHAINLTTGEVSTSIMGGNADNYPVRDFPPARTTTAAVFVQDEMQLADKRLRLIPGLRLDHYRFQPQADALFDSQPFAQHVRGQTDNHVSPKLGAVWQFNRNFNAYAQYASGFRAPPYSDLGLLFSNLRFGYAAIPNPELKPETSRSLELGLRGEGAIGHLTLSLYDNRYRNFIDSQHTLDRSDWPDWAAATPGLAVVFQSVNLTRARIRGAEASGVLYLDALSTGLDGWQVRGSLSAARGDARQGDGELVPLDSVDPARAVLGIGYEGYAWGIELDATGVARKHRLDNDEAFRAPGYATVDLYGHWSPVPALDLYAGVTNLGNRRYWNWGTLHGGTLGSTVDTSEVIGRYSSPGRALSVAAKWTF